jgi:hypothetical protein
MMLEVRKTLVWGTIAAAVVSALWLGASDGSLPRLGAAVRAGDDRPVLRLERHVPAPVAPSTAR